MRQLGTLKSKVARRAGRGYVVGPRLEDALAAAERLGRPVTLGFWDAQGDRPDAVALAYTQAIEALASRALDGYVSIKLPALGRDASLARRVATVARQAGQFIHFDSLAEAAATETLELALELAEEGLVGATVPGAWSRSVADAVTLGEAGVRVRVVKGQWPGDREPAGGFLDIVDALASAGRRVAVASHDAGLVRTALDRLTSAGADAELELLYGLPFRPAEATALALGVRTRAYVPYGLGYVPYALAQLRRRPVILWWLTRDAILGRHSVSPPDPLGTVGALSPRQGS